MLSGIIAPNQANSLMVSTYEAVIFYYICSVILYPNGTLQMLSKSSWDSKIILDYLGETKVMNE